MDGRFSLCEKDEFMDELRQVGWNVLHENPGYGFDEWVQTLIEQYPSEVVDAISTHPSETYASRRYVGNRGLRICGHWRVPLIQRLGRILRH